MLRGALNPPRAPADESPFRVGDRVMQTVNDYEREVFNGDLGRVAEVAGGRLVADFSGRPVVYDGESISELVLAYAISVHKSQGSEYPAVVMPLTMDHYTMLRRNLLYTAVTRGRRLVVIVGQRRALARAVRNADTGRRFSGLKRRLKEAPRKVSPSWRSGGPG
jgi:exodeoxyribonuclease V alpha subunit